MRVVGLLLILIVLALIIYCAMRFGHYFLHDHDAEIDNPADMWEPVFEVDGVMAIWYVRLPHHQRADWKSVLVDAFAQDDNDFDAKYMEGYTKACQRAEIMNYARKMKLPDYTATGRRFRWMS